MKISMKFVAAFALSGFGLLPWTASADTLQMKDGRVVQGRFMGGTQASVQFETNGRIELYDVDQVISLTFTSATPAPQATAERIEPAPRPRETSDARRYQGTTVPAGAHLLVRMIDSVDSEKNHVGDRFRASLEEDLEIDGNVIALRGTDVYGRLSEAKDAGHFEGKSQLKLELTDLLIRSKLQPVMTGDYEVSGSSRGSNTAKKVGGGAVAGAIIGALAGGGKGAAIGAGIGAGAGGAVQVFTKGEKVQVPSETLLDFRIEQPFTVSNDAN